MVVNARNPFGRILSAWRDKFRSVSYTRKTSYQNYSLTESPSIFTRTHSVHMPHLRVRDLFYRRWTFSRTIQHLMGLFDPLKPSPNTWPRIPQHSFKTDTGNRFTTTVGKRSQKIETVSQRNLYDPSKVLVTSTTT